MEPKASENLPVIVEADEFLSRMAEEIKRSDRYNHPFTVLILRPPAGQEDSPIAAWLESLALGLVRGCDIVSVFEAQNVVAVLLPETGVSGGSALLERFRAVIADSEQEWDFKLLEYPTNQDAFAELTGRAA